MAISLDGPNGHRLFQLSANTDIAFVIHYEPEDSLIPLLEKMLVEYPKAKVIWAHFGQLRAPDLQKSFSPELVRRLLRKYPNLYFDLSTGHPNRAYSCSNLNADTVIWQTAGGRQLEKLDQAYAAVLTQFSKQFVVEFDYGGGRAPLPQYLAKRTGNIRAILRDLPQEAQHNIAYRNAWTLLTGTQWQK